MTMTAEQERTAQDDLRALRRELAEARDEIGALHEIIAGGDHARWGAERLAGKVRRQRVMLDRLTRRVTSQRFQLRLLNELGRGLSGEEFREAVARIGDERLRDRVEAP